MSKPFTNPFFEADMSKMFDMSKITGDMHMPQFNMEAAANLHRKNIEACTALNQAVFESFQALWKRQAETARQIMEETAQTMQAIASSPTPEEKVIRHAEASKATMDKCIANVRDVNETIAKCNAQALETVSTRMTEGIDELRGIIRTIVPPLKLTLFKLIATGMMLFCIMSVSACGKKPPHVDAPEGSDSRYPLVYPDPKTNP